jgi:hypothetical protein
MRTKNTSMSSTSGLRGEELLSWNPQDTGYPFNPLKNKGDIGHDDETIEDIQSQIMSELNTKEQPRLVPMSY